MELIREKLRAIKKDEDKKLFKQTKKSKGIKTPPSGIRTNLKECLHVNNKIEQFLLIGSLTSTRKGSVEIFLARLGVKFTNQVLIEIL